MWQIRVDIHMLNHDGNLMDAASIAAITALYHFKRPDVGIQGEEVTVVSRQRGSRWCLCFTESTLNAALFNLSSNTSFYYQNTLTLGLFQVKQSNCTQQLVCTNVQLLFLIYRAFKRGHGWLKVSVQSYHWKQHFIMSKCTKSELSTW